MIWQVQHITPTLTICITTVLIPHPAVLCSVKFIRFKAHQSWLWSDFKFTIHSHFVSLTSNTPVHIFKPLPQPSFQYQNTKFNTSNKLIEKEVCVILFNKIWNYISLNASILILGTSSNSHSSIQWQSIDFNSKVFFWTCILLSLSHIGVSSMKHEAHQSWLWYEQVQHFTVTLMHPSFHILPYIFSHLPLSCRLGQTLYWSKQAVI